MRSLLWESLSVRFHRRLVVVALAFASAVAGLSSPFFQKIFLDRMLGTEAISHGWSGFGWLETVSPLAVMGFAFVSNLFASALSLTAGYCSMIEGLVLQNRWSERLYRKMISIRIDAMGSTTVGEVVSIYAVDVPGSTALVDQALPMGAGIVFPMVFAPIAIQYLCGIPLTASLFVIAVIVTLNVVLSKRQALFFRLFKQLAAERTGIVNEWIQNIRLLRILGWTEKFEQKIFRKRQEETRNRVKMVTNGQLMGTFGSSISFVINVIGVATLIYARGQGVTPGELFAMLWIFGVFLSRPFRQIPWIFTFSMDSLTSMKRVAKFLDRPSDPDEISEPASEVSPHATSLEVRGLELSIGGNRLLEDVSFTVAPGEFVGIVGEVGSGKSLLLLSLVGETGATFESLKIGGVDVSGWSLDERRRRFALVSQDGFVMSASLRDNICFRYDSSAERDEKVSRALELAQFRLSGEHLSDGLETEIGERGVNLSGGQKQRVALARAHALERSILLLDDCLSAVDVDTERLLIEKLIGGAWKDRTRVLVTHRLSVLEKVDRIFFVREGRIAEAGSFLEVYARSQELRDFVASVKRAEAVTSDPTEKGGQARAATTPIQSLS
ncbi:MAG: ABC transporter ATP-binding protein [Bdellovibrionota bacterium]